MRKLMLAVSLLQISSAALAESGTRYRQAVVEDAFIELHTGPGRGYPVFYVAGRGEEISILKRRTDWFKVKVPRGEEGWVSRGQLAETLDLSGSPLDIPGFTLEDYAARRWEVGALYGDFGGANVTSAYGGFFLTENLSVELWLSDVLGRYSNSQVVDADIVHTFYPRWRASPYFTLGAGSIHTEPKGTLVAAIDRTDNIAHAGLGMRAYIGRRFMFRAEYKTYVVFTSRDDNEEIREWKAGFSFFF